jgi:predicted PurR-regulated permease PerM
MSAPGALSPRHARFIAFIVVALLFLAGVRLGLMVPIFAGLLVYASIMHTSVRIAARGPGRVRSRWLAAAAVAGVVIAVLVAAGIGIHFLFRNGAGIHALVLKMGDILGSTSSALPDWVSSSIPQQDDLLPSIGNWLKSHATAVGDFGLGTLKVVGYALVGILLGIMVALSELSRLQQPGPVGRQLLDQIIALRESFWRVASAQIRISAVNTVLTSIYLLVVLPLFGVQLPLAKTLVALTFIAGLLPIVGNLISNSAITVLSISLSFNVALASLVFLIVVHKLEYFVNARIVGSQINAKAWEILLWMLLMERLFGPAGVVVAPVFYAWLKTEWHAWDRQPELANTDTGEA